jgi:Integrase core domain
MGRGSKRRDELLNETLFFSLDHARQAITEWVEDYTRQGHIHHWPIKHQRPAQKHLPQQAILL